MAKKHLPNYPFFIFLITKVLLLLCGAINDDDDRKVHIVYMGALSKEIEYSPLFHHKRLLEEIIEDGIGIDHLLRSYTKSFNGFAANLTAKEAQKLERMDGIVSVFPSTRLELSTTRSWDFVGFTEKAKRNPVVESDIIIGIMDNGIWPERFNDKGFGPPPKKWRGVCQGGKDFTCNNKIIGARTYGKVVARDKNGHGTHVASIAAGNIEKNVSFYGFGQGSARGGVPYARIAIYAMSYTSVEVLAAFDDAIADGVDIISLSFNSPKPLPLEKSAASIGSFHALQNNILTVQSAGNFGPMAGSISSIAPWLFSVAASNTDRRIINKVVLKNNITLIGNSINAFESTAMTPVVLGNSTCIPGEVIEPLKRKVIILCNNSMGAIESFEAGAVGAITLTNFKGSRVSPFPTSAISYRRPYQRIMNYLRSTNNPQAKILKSEVVKNKKAPSVLYASSRGPNKIIPDILKPDITALGVEILAAFPPNVPPTMTPSDKRSAKYNILTGTSMACPHVTGAAAYDKSLHPNWSPSAIKSALMTTAKSMRSKIHEFSYGVGQIDPVKAANPGLVYDASIEDYVTAICSMGYSGKRLKSMTGSRSIRCTKSVSINSSMRDLNYPSMTANVKAKDSFHVVFKRTVTNVGPAKSNYTAIIGNSLDLDITVVPYILTFKSVNQKISFVVTVKGYLQPGLIASTSLTWSSRTINVISHIVVYT